MDLDMNSKEAVKKGREMSSDQDYKDLDERVRSIEITSARTEEKVSEMKADMAELLSSMKAHLEKDEQFYISVVELKLKDQQKDKDIELRKQELDGLKTKIWSAIGGLTLIVVGAVVQLVFGLFGAK